MGDGTKGLRYATKLLKLGRARAQLDTNTRWATTGWEKDPGLDLMRSGTDCGNKWQRVDCSVVSKTAQKEPALHRE